MFKPLNKKIFINFLVVLGLAAVNRVLAASNLGLVEGRPQIGPYLLIENLGDMVVYADLTSPRPTSRQTLIASHLVQHEPSTENTRSMVYHQEINCWARTIADTKVEHWSGDWGNGEVLLTETVHRKPQKVGYRSLRGRLVDFFCSNYPSL